MGVDYVDLELDTEKNQYETQQSTSSADQRAEDINEALKKLDELARRQEQLAAERRNNSAQGVEQRWQQEMLQREAEQLQRQMEQLAQQGLTDAQVREDLRAQLVSEAIFNKVSGEVKVTDKQIAAYYAKQKSQYSQPESREVRHILVKDKALAEKLYKQIRANKGATFTALAKKYSEDPGSKNAGGKTPPMRTSTRARCRLMTLRSVIGARSSGTCSTCSRIVRTKAPLAEFSSMYFLCAR